ncbi:Haloalkane dehalogenase [Planctomycetes bacterium Pan216]|uniref:Haloalkane dehalogenase n=1 Tax=Kolteria novifilia TaxID=2527975 RepID=A0A518B1S2_9BACT|nr:Haloalkane dehalogenase [Planctomycetes bacterium Pan216]
MTEAIMDREQTFTSEYPFASHWLDIDGWRYHYVDEGAGDPILFVHGNPTWSFAFRRLIQHFSPTHRALAVDHLGCGLSDKPADWTYRLANHVHNLRCFVRQLDLRDVTLVVHDWGGPIGLGVFVEELERVRRVVIMNTAAYPSSRIPKRIAMCRWPLFGTVAIRGFNGFSQAALRMATAHPEQWTQAARQGYLFPYDSWEHRIAVDRFVKDIPMQPNHPSYPMIRRLEKRLPRLADKPILLAWGMRDWCFTPHFLERFQEIYPDAETAAFDDAGHYLFEDAPAALAAKIEEFISRT